MIREPYDSPWGEVEHCNMICAGVFNVSTARHGGVMIDCRVADQLISHEAQECGFIENGYLCFEEDCDAAVAIYELLNKGIMQAPINEFWKEEEYAEAIVRSIKDWNPEYWAKCGTDKPTLTKKDRGDAR